MIFVRRITHNPLSVSITIHPGMSPVRTAKPTIHQNSGNILRKQHYLHQIRESLTNGRFTGEYSIWILAMSTLVIILNMFTHPIEYTLIFIRCIRRTLRQFYSKICNFLPLFISNIQRIPTHTLYSRIRPCQQLIKFLSTRSFQGNHFIFLRLFRHFNTRLIFVIHLIIIATSNPSARQQRSDSYRQIYFFHISKY
ncbi:hypothetical protein EVA_03955 [gut metagenome]|uniref:Uncharacterized protein n=1 Tax=gut metagenome TaxID=749906 RepID=J9H2Y0_9ZZZZ